MLNRITLIGRLTKDIELKTTTTGKDVTTFGIASQRNGKDAIADFINCVAWNQSARYISQYARKGTLVYVDGTLQSRVYEDRQNNKKFALEVLVQSLGILAQPKEQHETNYETNAYESNATDPYEDVVLPNGVGDYF